jgi:cell fate regulator YaaT (PSP1 superfamily)
VGWFEPRDERAYDRGTLVVCHTARGLEVGEVLLCSLDRHEPGDGELVRHITPADELQMRDHRRRQSYAFEAGQAALERHGASVALIDVERLFDGSSTYFYVVGDLGNGSHDVLRELSVELGTEIRFHTVAPTTPAGCGAACGSDGGGCSAGHCATCPAVGVCKK